MFLVDMLANVNSNFSRASVYQRHGDVSFAC